MTRHLHIGDNRAGGVNDAYWAAWEVGASEEVLEELSELLWSKAEVTA